MDDPQRETQNFRRFPKGVNNFGPPPKGGGRKILDLMNFSFNVPKTQFFHVLGVVVLSIYIVLSEKNEMIRKSYGDFRTLPPPQPINNEASLREVKEFTSWGARDLRSRRRKF